MESYDRYKQQRSEEVMSNLIIIDHFLYHNQRCLSVTKMTTTTTTKKMQTNSLIIKVKRLSSSRNYLKRRLIAITRTILMMMIKMTFISVKRIKSHKPTNKLLCPFTN